MAELVHPEELAVVEGREVVDVDLASLEVRAASEPGSPELLLSPRAGTDRGLGAGAGGQASTSAPAHSCEGRAMWLPVPFSNSSKQGDKIKTHLPSDDTHVDCERSIHGCPRGWPT